MGIEEDRQKLNFILDSIKFNATDREASFLTSVDERLSDGRELTWSMAKWLISIYKKVEKLEG